MRRIIRNTTTPWYTFFVPIRLGRYLGRSSFRAVSLGRLSYVRSKLFLKELAESIVPILTLGQLNNLGNRVAVALLALR